MKKLVVSLVVISNLMFAAEYCDLENKTIKLTKQDAFGNIKKIITNKFDELTDKLAKDGSKKSKIITMKIFGEIFALNRKGLIYDCNDGKERYINFSVFTETVIPLTIKSGRLPAQINLNISNLQTKNMKINTTVSVYNLAGSLMSYIYPKDFDTSRDRILALLSFFTAKNFYFLPRHCKKFDITSIGAQIMRTLIALIQAKDPSAIKITYFLAKNDFNKVDELLLKDNESYEFFKIAKQHYLKTLKE